MELFMENSMPWFGKLLCYSTPKAIADIRGNSENQALYGSATFYDFDTGGVLIQVEVFGLPDDKLPGHSGFFGMHIHQYGNCAPPFDQTGNHYNPANTEHPWHAGDLPPLLSGRGYAWTTFYDSRFSLSEILQKSLIIHAHADDFTTQPSGNSGNKIACGVIRPLQ